MAKKISKEEMQRRKTQVLTELTRHVGEANAIGMGELYSSVFNRPWNNRISDTRPLRRVITDLRNEGVPIGSTPSNVGGGYYLPAAGSELIEYLGRIRKGALKMLFMESQIRKISLAELLGQMRLNLGNQASPSATPGKGGQR